MKDKFLKVLYRIWSVGIPVLLGLAFAFSCFMGIWKILGAPLWLSIVFLVLISAGAVYSVGKMIRLW